MFQIPNNYYSTIEYLEISTCKSLVIATTSNDYCDAIQSHIKWNPKYSL